MFYYQTNESRDQNVVNSEFEHDRVSADSKREPFYIVGLGNPGEKYADTRHNVGWIMLDALREQCGLPDLIQSAKYAGRISEGVLSGIDVTLLYPDTFMNKSGSAVAKLVPKTESAQLIVVYDEVDLAVGEVKVSFGRGDGGHNGIKSIVQSLGTKEFVRIRVGISPKSFWTGKTKRPAGAKLPNYVLGKFGSSEQKHLEAVKEQIPQIIATIITDGVEQAMNRFN